MDIRTFYKTAAEVVALLLAAFPEGADLKDSDGALPLQRALENKASAEVLALLQGAERDGR